MLSVSTSQRRYLVAKIAQIALLSNDFSLNHCWTGGLGYYSPRLLCNLIILRWLNNKDNEQLQSWILNKLTHSSTLKRLIWRFIFGMALQLSSEYLRYMLLSKIPQYSLNLLNKECVNEINEFNQITHLIDQKLNYINDLTQIVFSYLVDEQTNDRRSQSSVNVLSRYDEIRSIVRLKEKIIANDESYGVMHSSDQASGHRIDRIAAVVRKQLQTVFNFYRTRISMIFFFDNPMELWLRRIGISRLVNLILVSDVYDNSLDFEDLFAYIKGFGYFLMYICHCFMRYYYLHLLPDLLSFLLYHPSRSLTYLKRGFWTVIFFFNFRVHPNKLDRSPLLEGLIKNRDKLFLNLILSREWFIDVLWTVFRSLFKLYTVRLSGLLRQFFSFLI